MSSYSFTRILVSSYNVRVRLFKSTRELSWNYLALSAVVIRALWINFHVKSMELGYFIQKGKFQERKVTLYLEITKYFHYNFIKVSIRKSAAYESCDRPSLEPRF